MKRTAVQPGLYKDDSGAYWVRPYVNSGRTWRKLRATGFKEAQREALVTLAGQHVAREKCEDDPLLKRANTFRQVAARYLADGCPDKSKIRRNEKFCEGEKSRMGFILQYFGDRHPESITLADLLDYRDWRMGHVVKGTGHRTVEMDWVTLSNALSYGVLVRLTKMNYVRTGRPHLRTDRPDSSEKPTIKHCRDKAPKSGDTLHKLADYLFSTEKSESLGWQMLFEACFGLRTNEALALRVDAERGKPGWIEGNKMFVHRSKRGIDPFVTIQPELFDMIDCWRYWHSLRYPKSPWFFPGRSPFEPLGRESLWHALKRACTVLELPPMSSHAMRAFYVTKRRCDDIPDIRIANEIGITSVDLVRRVYGNRPDNWVGEQKLSWLPSEGLPAWARWRGGESKVVGLNAV